MNGRNPRFSLHGLFGQIAPVVMALRDAKFHMSRKPEQGGHLNA
jgi:hypothetical protein